MQKKSFKLNLTLWAISIVAVHLTTYLLISFVRLDFDLWGWLVSFPIYGRIVFLCCYYFVVLAVLALKNGIDIYYMNNKDLK